MKKVLQFFKKFWFYIFSAILILGIFLYLIFFNKPVTMFENNEIETRIISVYHVETFEGGKVSRINYLKNIARQIEKENNTVLFMIKQIEPSELESCLEQNTPDIMSFGFGVGKTVLKYLAPLDNSYKIRDELVDSACFNNKLYALPYIASGYCKIERVGNENDNYFSSGNGFVYPEKAADLTFTKYDSQYKAYKAFVYDDHASLIGTARDLFRVDNLNKNNRINASITPLDSYSDLIQYAGVSVLDSVTSLFLKMLVDENEQAKLKDYGLFGVNSDNLYFDGIYSDMEKAIKNCKIANVFND